MADDDYAYRFQYADESAFVVYPDGRAFITFPEKDGRRRPPEQKFGKIDNRIPLLIGYVAKPRQEKIARLRDALERYGQHEAGCETETWHGKGPLRCSCGYYEAVEDTP